MMTDWESIGLVGSAVGAGAVNAVAGGGTLLTFPTLLAFGVSPVTANATSILALVLGTSGGMFGNRKHVQPVVPWLKRLLPLSLVGGLIGSVPSCHGERRHRPESNLENPCVDQRPEKHQN